ncbi:MAG TPA: GTPase Era [Chromatiales bacterium]|jgi:GTP-binding protein Era|nr:GTPase Era [Chromatiales bacterium]
MTMRSGYIALLGQPNVGKSTLLNRLLGQKISITSRRPQTTRHRVLGIQTTDSAQTIFVDTPGIHDSEEKAMNRYLNRAARSVVGDVNAIAFMVSARGWTKEDDYSLKSLEHNDAPVVLVINKVDQLGDKHHLLPLIDMARSKHDFIDIVPISARTGANLEALESVLQRLLPEGDLIFPEDQITDRSERFLAAEIIREKLTRRLAKELPYALTVEIELFKEEGNGYHIAAVIWVERPGQKGIVIGEKGKLLKTIGEQSRLDMEKLFDRKVFLQTWVKVRKSWSDDERSFASLGFDDV